MTGEQFNVTTFPGNGEPRVIAGFLNGQAVTAPAWRVRSGTPGLRPAAASAAPPPPGQARQPARRRRRIGRGQAGPRRDVPLPRHRLRQPAAAAPARLPRRDPADLSARTAVRAAWAGTAAGIVPAPGEASGWLQAVLRDDGEVSSCTPP